MVMFVSVASRGSFLALVVSLLLRIASAGVQHNVGDKAGWKLPSLAKINYTDWASQHSFQVQDTLHFRYDPGVESVLEVTLAAYESCSNSSPMATYDDGETVVYLLRAGRHWFVCGNPSHCSSGQKFSILVQPLLHHRSYPDDSPSAGPAAQGFYGGFRRIDPVAVPSPASPPSFSSGGAAEPVLGALVYCIVSAAALIVV